MVPTLAVSSSSGLETEDHVSWIFRVARKVRVQILLPDKRTQKKTNEVTLQRSARKLWKTSLLPHYSHHVFSILYLVVFIHLYTISNRSKVLKIHCNYVLVQNFIIQFPVQGCQFCRGFWENCRQFFPLLSSQKLLLGSLSNC